MDVLILKVFKVKFPPALVTVGFGGLVTLVLTELLTCSDVLSTPASTKHSAANTHKHTCTFIVRVASLQFKFRR